MIEQIPPKPENLRKKDLALIMVVDWLAETLEIEPEQLISFKKKDPDQVVVSAIPCKRNFGLKAFRLLTKYAVGLEKIKSEDSSEDSLKQLDKLTTLLKDRQIRESDSKDLQLTPHGQALFVTAESISQKAKVDVGSLIEIQPSRKGGGSKVVTSPCKINFGNKFQRELKKYAKDLNENKETANHDRLKELAKKLINIKEGIIMLEELKNPVFTQSLHTVVRDIADLLRINPIRLMREFNQFDYGKPLEKNVLQPTQENIGPQFYRALIQAARTFTRGGLKEGRGVLDHAALIGSVDNPKKLKKLQLDKKEEDNKKKK